MKLVIQDSDTTTVRTVRECDLETTIARITSTLPGLVVTPLAYEVFRYRLPKGVAIIYHDNRIIRTKNFWFEVRGLAALAKELGVEFLHEQRLNFSSGIQTEVDGIDRESQQVMVELKQTVITQEWVDFYSSKRKRLALRECIIVAPSFAPTLQLPPHVRTFEFQPDIETLMTYYRHKFTLPEWFAPCISSRHVRVLLSSGNWRGIQRKLTQTAKHSPESKLVIALNVLARRGQMPVRIYYSLSPMAIPAGEFRGRGYPLHRVLAAFDVDASHKNHVIGPEGFCKECIADAELKAALLAELFQAQGWHFVRVFSGSKGFHFYLLEDGGGCMPCARELSESEALTLAATLTDSAGNALTDNIHFRARDGSFDVHRIFKLPGSIDAATGIVVGETFERLPFRDQMIEYFHS